MDRLAHLYHEGGQSPWLDNLKRSYITGGELQRQIDRGIRGLTSNPTIFQKAIQGSADYDDQHRSLIAAGGSTLDHYWAMVLSDIHGALDAFAPLYEHSFGGDGYVSVEVAPSLAHDGPGTEAAARHLHVTVNRPNLMVKIPSTREGLPAIEQMIAEGRNVNVTINGIDDKDNTVGGPVMQMPLEAHHDLASVEQERELVMRSTCERLGDRNVAHGPGDAIELLDTP